MFFNHFIYLIPQLCYIIYYYILCIILGITVGEQCSPYDEIRKLSMYSVSTFDHLTGFC